MKLGYLTVNGTVFYQLVVENGEKQSDIYIKSQLFDSQRC